MPSNTLTAADVDTLMGRRLGPEDPGVVIGLFSGADVVIAHSIGCARLGDGIPFGRSTTLPIGCVSNQFIAFGVAVLVERGVIQLDTDVRDYLPELPRYGRRIDVHHLINHTSGIPDFWSLCSVAGLRSHELSRERLMELLRTQTFLNFDPGSLHLWSASNYLLLELIIDRATGLSCRTFCEQEIFAPNGMADTFIASPSDRPPECGALGYERAEGRVKSVTDCAHRNHIVTSLSDLGPWNGLLQQGWREPRTGAAGLSYTRGHLNDGSAVAHAFGQFITSIRGRETYLAGGHSPGFSCGFCRFPVADVAVAVLSNAAWLPAVPMALAAAVKHFDGVSVFLGDRDSPRRGPRFGKTWRAHPRCDGVYFCRDLNTYYYLRVEGGKLVRTCRNRERFFVQSGETSFTTTEADSDMHHQIRLTCDERGRVAELRVSTKWNRALRFQRVS